MLDMEFPSCIQKSSVTLPQPINNDELDIARTENVACEIWLMDYAKRVGVLTELEEGRMLADKLHAAKLNGTNMAVVELCLEAFEKNLQKLRKKLREKGINYIANKGHVKNMFKQLDEVGALVDGKCLVFREPTMFAFACWALGLENVVFMTDDRLMADTIIAHSQNYLVGVWNKNQNIANIFNQIINILKGFNIMKFDIILGNPPFQKPKKSQEEQKDQEEKSQNKRRLGSQGDTNLFDGFVLGSLNNLLNKDGYLGFITPPSWRKPEERLWNIMTKANSLCYLKMYSPNQGGEMFGFDIRVDLFILQKGKRSHNSKIIDHNDVNYSLDLKQYEWLPNSDLDLIFDLLDPTNPCKVFYNTAYHTQFNEPRRYYDDEPTDNFVHPVVHTITKEGLGIKYFDHRKTDIHFGVSKVLLNQNELQYPVNDWDGKYGMSQLTFGIAITSKEDGDLLVDFLNSEKGKRIISVAKWNTYYTNYKMFKSFKDGFWR